MLGLDYHPLRMVIAKDETGGGVTWNVGADSKGVSEVTAGSLGVITSPDGDSQAAIVMIQEKAQQWVNDVRNGHLHQHNVWFLLKVQLWPRIGYGICSSTATFKELSMALHPQYYQILPLGGIVRTTTVESRTIDSGFYSMGLPHLGVEALIAMLNKLLMHYGCNTATGQFMQVSYSLFLVELGISFQPLHESYSKYGFLSTHSWMKMLWEKISMFRVKIVVANEAIKYPREGDQFIMQLLFEMGYPWESLRRLNCMCIFLQVLFLSDILTALGNKINPEVLLHRSSSKMRSCMQWPTECPTESDFQLWRDAMHSLCPRRCSHAHIGHFTVPTQKIWRWTWDDASGFLCHASNDGSTEDVFVAGQKPNRFYYLYSRPSSTNGTLCSVEPTHASGRWRLTSLALAATPPPAPQTFMEVSHSWGNTWLWDNLLIVGGFNWLHEAIWDGTLAAVTDSSYIRELYPNLCSAAFVIECAKGRGLLMR